MAAYETYETDKDYDTMEMENTSAAERVLNIFIILIRSNVLYIIEVFRVALLWLCIIFCQTLLKAPVATPPVKKRRGHKKV